MKELKRKKTNMKLDEQTINEIVSNLKPSIMEGVKNELQSSISHQVKQTILNQIGEYCKTWVQENIIPEIEKELIESKDGLIKIGTSVSEEITEEIAISMAATIKKKLENSWDRKKIFEALIN